jgi:heterotetrameric sarcosine oxidase gamma subunit
VDKSPDTAPAVESHGLRVTVLRGLAASLRYFDHMGRFAETVRETVGMSLPPPLRAATRSTAGSGAEFILAWRSPTETLLLCTDHDQPVFADLQQRLATAVGGSMVDQTGGIRGYRIQGQRSLDLMQRMGATTAIPAMGEARGGRLAEVQVLTVCIAAGEFLLLTERVYADHLVEWMRATVADFKQ